MHPDRTCRRLPALICGFLLAATTVPAVAGCPSHERVNAVVRAWHAKMPVRGLPTLSRAGAECGRARFVGRLRLTDGPVVGYKAGLTHPDVQKRFGVTEPVRGMLLEDMLLPDGAEVDAHFGARPVFEADLLVEVKDAAIHEARTHLEILASLSRVMPFIELPDLLVAEGETLTAELIVFLNVGARLGVVGEGVPVEVSQRFARALADMQVVVTDQKGGELARGRGDALLGHPLNAVLWLVQDLGRSGIRLKPGDLLSLGSFTPLMPPRPGLTATVRYEGLPGTPSVSVRFR
jgi:2-keto-4-pentenoate hydratase